MDAGKVQKKPLRGIIDMHIHTAPDVRPRRLTDIALMEAAVKTGVRAVVVKSHLLPTVDRAALVNEVYRNGRGDPGSFTMFGGITLNASVGGINPHAVEAALRLGGKVVWLPTNTSSNHLRKQGKSGGVEAVTAGKPVPALKDVMNLVRDHNAVLATGHLSPEEIRIVVEAAREAGVKKIVVTHPEFWVVGMTLEEQIKLARDCDVLFERCYAQPVGGGAYRSNLEENALAIREIGYKNIVIATDSGQMENPRWPDSLAEYVGYLAAAGIPEDHIDYMARKSPANLLEVR